MVCCFYLNCGHRSAVLVVFFWKAVVIVRLEIAMNARCFFCCSGLLVSKFVIHVGGQVTSPPSKSKFRACKLHKPRHWCAIVCLLLIYYLVGACGFTNYRVGGQTHPPLSSIFHMGLFGLERVINACCNCCRELMVSDSISCWWSINSPNLRPMLNCNNCLGLNPLCGYLFFIFLFCFSH